MEKGKKNETIKRIPGQLGGVLVRFSNVLSPVTDAPLHRSNHYEPSHFNDGNTGGGPALDRHLDDTVVGFDIDWSAPLTLPFPEGDDAA